MTNTFNIAGADGSVMVPVLSETGSLMAYLLSPDPTGILRELYGCMTIPRALPDNSLTTPRQLNSNSGTTPHEALYYKNAFGCTGQPIIHSKLKIRKMAKTTSISGVSGDRIKNDPLFERTRENMAEFSRAGKAAKLVRSIFRDVTINAKDKVTQARLVKVTSRVAQVRLWKLVSRKWVVYLLTSQFFTMSNIINRMQDSTPKFFKILRNIGVVLAAVSAAVFASPVVLPNIVTDIAGYLAVAGSVMGAVSQSAVLYEDE